MSKIEVNTIDVQCGSTLTLGSSGKTVTLATGASQSGFGRTGTVDWQTSSIKTATFTAVNGEGYFCNTTGGAFTVNLPAGSAGAIVAVSDYTRTFATNNLTIAANGSEKIGGVAETLQLDVNGQALTLVYVDATEGWINVQNAEDTETGVAAAYVTASGGNATITCGDYKTHIFTSSGTLGVTCAGNSKGSNKIDYFVVGGGGSGGHFIGAGGGAGGFRLSNEYGTPAPTMSPLANSTGITITAGSIPVTVGAGASFHDGPSASYSNRQGSVSVFSTITSAGGGGGGYFSQEPGSPVPKGVGGPGGSGGGGDYNCGTPYPGTGTSNVGGTGNTPPVSPPQGNNGGRGNLYSPSTYGEGGGGGAGAVGGDSTPPMTSGAGGAGSFIADAIIGPTAPSYGTPGPVSSTRYFAGGGGGGGNNSGSGGAGGTGGGGTGAISPNNPPTLNGTANTGGGGGGEGGYPSPGPTAGTGGSGIVIVRYKFQ